MSGKTVNEAVDAALKELNTTIEKVKVTVLEEGSKGLFGFFGKEAQVEVELKYDGINEAKKFLQELLEKFKINGLIEVLKQKDYVLFNVVGRNLGQLIGHHGKTLDSLQYLTNIIANKYNNDEKIKIIIDIESYRAKREQTLKRLADSVAQKVLKTGRSISLEPMTAFERKIIHTHLQEQATITTFSKGEEPYRRIIIAKK